MPALKDILLGASVILRDPYSNGKPNIATKIMSKRDWSLLGWKNKVSDQSWPIDAYRHDRHFINMNYEHVANFDEYHHAWWVNDSYIAELAYENIGQLCVDCKCPAPHAKANQPDDKYLCSYCACVRNLWA